jgi:hypothetical protein
MARESPHRVLARLGAASHGTFRGSEAVELGVTRKQLQRMVSAGAIDRVLPDTYRRAGLPASGVQQLVAALLWAGGPVAAAGRSGGEVYGLEGVTAPEPEIVVPRANRCRVPGVVVHRVADLAGLMIRRHDGLRVTGPEATLVALAAVLDAEALEIACEDARRRRLTSVPALRAYLERHGRRGLGGTTALRALLAGIDPVHAAASTLEVRTRRLLVAHGYTDFSREFPLEWNGRRYRFDFCFEAHRTILETNGRRWHHDPADFERDQEKWSVPGRHGFRLVLATWDKVTRRPGELVAELAATFAA